MTPALLVVDTQKAFIKFRPATAQCLNDAIEYINPGGEGFALPEELDNLPSDLHIHKTYGNAFNKTPLEDELRPLGVNTVVITDFCAEYCSRPPVEGQRISI